MRLYSTNNKESFVSLQEAVMKGLPDDNGLFMPEAIPVLPKFFLDNLEKYSLPEIAYTICDHLFQGYIPKNDLANIIENAVTFPAPIVSLDDDTHVLELFHGPSLAFKDFGARFMAQLMSYFNRNESKELVILVATSGDTGGAVASGFLKTEGIKVVILYPSGKVSMLQEKQLTALGHNIAAIEIDGTFDDCQALVKKAFLDNALNRQIRLSSANSINIARLIPQSFYYFEAYKQLLQQNQQKKSVDFVIPSGNFGNLTAGVLAQKMGLPVRYFVAATNANDVVPNYLKTGDYTPRKSVRTLSNAMDVGAPSNFARLLDIYCSTWNNMTASIKGYAFTDEETKVAMQEVYKKYNYVIDPHGAVGYLAWRKHQEMHQGAQGIILETAHPSKFIDDVEKTIQTSIKIPARLAELADAEKQATFMQPDFESFKSWLMAHY